MAPKQSQQDPAYVDEHHQRISEFANDYFDDEEERSAFVDTLMERRGYVRRSAWAAPEPQPQQPPAGEAPQGGGEQQPKRAPYFRR